MLHDYGKMLLIEKGRLVTVRNEGKTVSFSSFTEFNRYWPDLDLTGKHYVDYESERFLHIDDTAGIQLYEGPVDQYEAVIAAVPILAARLADPFYGLSPQEAKERQIALKKGAVEQAGFLVAHALPELIDLLIRETIISEQDLSSEANALLAAHKAAVTDLEAAEARASRAGAEDADER